jgi:hypothetical protein
MCTHKLPVLPVLALAAVSLVGIGAATRSRPSSIEGVWRTAEVRLGGPGARTVSPTEPSMAIITSKHYSRVESHAERPRPVVLDPATATADELRAAWGPFYAEAGTYQVSNGNVLTMHSVVSKNPAAMASGSVTMYTYRAEGDTLWMTQQRDLRGPVANPATIKLVRVN